MDVMSLRADSGRFAGFALSIHGKRAILSHLAPSGNVSCYNHIDPRAGNLSLEDTGNAQVFAMASERQKTCYVIMIIFRIGFYVASG